MSSTSDNVPLLSEEQASIQDDLLVSGTVQVLSQPSELDPVQQQYAAESPAPNQPLLVVYTRRWYILILFGLLACHQCIVWNTWGPIESGVQFAYNWSNSTAPMMANWGTIMFCLSVVPLSKLLEVT